MDFLKPECFLWAKTLRDKVHDVQCASGIEEFSVFLFMMAT